MFFGAHVGHAGGLAASLQRGLDIGAEAIQLFTQSPRQWRPGQRSPEVVKDYRRLRDANPQVGSVLCHATYLINLANPDPLVADRSRECLASNLAVIDDIDADGLVLHVGSHRGAGLESCLSAVAETLVASLDEAGPRARILLENTAGGGGTIGRSFSELGAVFDAAGGDERLGLCLDTQHLWASGVDFASPTKAEAVVRLLDQEVGLGRLEAIHLNDSKVAFGSQRDRHENLDQGTIGARGLAPLLGHPALQGLPAILEVSGPEGKGPTRVDLDCARAIHRRGVSAHRRRIGSARS